VKKSWRWAAAAVVVAMAMLVAAVNLRPARPRPSAPTAQAILPALGAPTGEPGSPTPSYLCPQATAEFLAVEPVTSPTEALSQVVTVRMGTMEAVTITAESGVFTAPDGLVTVDLLPNTVHHLEVTAKVRQTTGSSGCTYGGYTLSTTRDKAGAPLVIVQGQPERPGSPAAVIGPENVARQKELVSFAPPARLTTDFAFLGADELVSVGYGDTIRRWSLATGQETGTVSGPEALVVAISPDGLVAATGGISTDPAVRVWLLATGEMRELGRHDAGAALESLAFSPSGRLLASGANDDTVRVWLFASNSAKDLLTGQPAATLHGDVPQRAQSFHSLAWASDDLLIAAGSDAIYWWDVTAGQVARRLALPEGVQFLVGAAFAAGGERIAAVAQDDRLYVWDQQWTSWPAEAGAMLGHVALSPDGRLAAAATYEGVWYVWDAATGELLASHPAAGPASTAGIRFSPDGRYLAVGGWEAPIRVWAILDSRS
jgi:WD40 repeat protein